MGGAKMKFSKTLFSFLAVLAFTAFLPAADQPGNKFGVYEYVLQKCQGEFDAVSQALETAVDSSSFQLLAKHDEKAPGDCTFKTRVFILYAPDYGKQILEANPMTGAFAVSDRINLFQDEAGLHISIVNPMSINRTVLMDDEKYRQISDAHRQALRNLITGAVTGTESEKQYGQLRKKGYIGKTMGIMAGGPFNKKMKKIAVAANGNLQDVVQKIASKFQGETGKWKLNQVYSLITDDGNTAVIGISSPLVEKKSFAIVKAGSDKSRKKFKCPGIAHAGAYPMEIVVNKDGSAVNVWLVNSMYRMKMYFEDAGKMAFAKNMGMPGSIQDEIESKIKSCGF